MPMFVGGRVYQNEAIMGHPPINMEPDLGGPSLDHVPCKGTGSRTSGSTFLLVGGKLQVGTRDN